MTKRFPEIEKEQFNARIPTHLVERIRETADRRGWSVGRTVTQAMSIGLGIDPETYGIETLPTSQS